MGYVRKVVFIVFIFWISLSSNAFAHDEGQPPFVTINGQSTKHAPITTTSLPDFMRAHDIMDSLYMINTPIYFVMDQEKLLYEEKLITGREFQWELGDGGKHTGTSFSHTYKKSGSYFVSMYAVDTKTEDKILVFRVILNVADNENYILPKVEIGILDKDTSGEVTADFSKPIILEAKVIESESPIVTYYWDLGDSQSSNLPVVEHTYDAFHAEARPILRVRDQNGFIADSSIEIKNSNVSTAEFENPANQLEEDKPSNFRFFIIILPIVVAIAGLVIYKKRTS